jgi:hypothetical protein
VTAAGVLRPGRLFRGALHDRSAPLVQPHGDGVAHLMDLRTTEEFVRLPVSWVCSHAWPLRDPEWTHGGDRSPAFFVDSALRLVPLSAGPMADLLMLLGRGERVYVGCRLGKDRTGLVVLLLGRLFGVSDAVLVRDYVRTAAEYAAASDWVRAYAGGRGEAVDRVARRLQVTEEVPAGILARLPERADLLALLGLTETAVRSAMLSLTRRTTSDGQRR